MIKLKMYEISPDDIKLLDAILDAMVEVRVENIHIKFKYHNKLYYISPKNANRVLRLMADLADTKEKLND